MKEILSNSAKVFFCICTYVAALNALDHQSSRHQDYYQMYLNKILTDFAIVSKEDTTFPCHKMVLFAANKYWQVLFSNANCKECREGKMYLPYSERVIQIILEKTYLPDQELIIGTIGLSDYLALLEFASLSFDRSLIDVLDRADIKFENNVLHALQATIINKDAHLGDLAFKYIRDGSIDEDVCNFLIEMLECNNEIIIHFMRRIRTSTLVKYLAKNNRDLLITHNILKDNKYILDMKNWSEEEVENELDEYNYKNTLNELIQNLQSNLLSRAENLQITTAEQVFSFLSTHFSINLLAAGSATFRRSTVMSSHIFWLVDFSEIFSKSVWEIALKAIRNIHIGWCVGCTNERYTIFQRAFNAVMNSNKEVMDHVVLNLKINNQASKAEAIVNLAQLFSLAYISESTFQNEYFHPTYEEIFNNLKPELTLYRGMINKIINSYSLNEGMKENPFIKSFKEIMTGIVARLDDI